MAFKISDACVKCGTCEGECPVSAISEGDSQYEIDDIILSEYGTTVVGLEMMRSVHEENAEESRKVQIVKSAINTLSFSELEAIIHIFDEENRLFYDLERIWRDGHETTKEELEA